MIRLRRAAPAIYAQHAAAYLRRHGILARTVETGITSLGPYSGHSVSGAILDVVIAHKGDREPAEAMLGDFDRTGIELEAGWEDDAKPDLSLLDPSVTAPCISCGCNLRGLGDAGQCPECHAPFDLYEAVFAAHGPDALVDCYPEPDAGDEFGMLADSISIDCPACRYRLDGLEQIGTCPECGRAYDKAEILRVMFDS